MKRIFVWILSLVTVLSLVACAKQPADTNATESTEVTESIEERKELAPLLELRGEIPALKSREEMLNVLHKEVYGYLPTPTFSLSVSEDGLGIL